MSITRRALLKDILWAIVFAGVVASLLRFAVGLGATTGLEDARPWGLWIAFKLGFVALAGGGFTLAGMVYILRLDAFRPVVRRAILLAALGYGSFIVSLLFDLGMPWHIYMPVIHWQHHSVMFEIAWCVLLYFSVLVMEFSPAILEHTWFQKPIFQIVLKILHALLIPLVIAGIVLSTLHQSSLGALFLIMPQRVHPLWYSSLIPVLFFVSAITAGLFAMVLEGFLSSRIFHQELDLSLYTRLGKIGAWGMCLYLALRVGDLAWRGVLPQAFDGSWQGALFLVEIVAGGLLPVFLMAVPRIRSRWEGLITAAMLAVLGILSQRMSLSMITMSQPGPSSYLPSLLEVIIGLAIPAAAVLIYLLFNENLLVLDYGRLSQTHPLSGPVPRGRQGSNRRDFARRSGVAVIVGALTLAGAQSSMASRQQVASQPVQGALGWEVLVIDGDRLGEYVEFPHAAHQALLQAPNSETPNPEGEASCLVCHHLSLPEDGPTSCWECHQDMHHPTTIFDHLEHQRILGGNASCVDCHQGEHLAFTTIECQTCHESMESNSQGEIFTALAPGYVDAMHGLCISCHQEQAELLGVPDLDECATCHFKPELHVDSFSQDCNACHTPDEWFELAEQQKDSFDHALLTGFSLAHHSQDYDGEAITCLDCHGDVESFTLGFEQIICLDCHALESPIPMEAHETRYGSACLDCHDGYDRMANLDHSQFFFLDGEHADLDCVTCHADHVYEGTPTECQDCHEEPQVHAGLFGLQCSRCHNSNAWSPAELVEHAFPITHGQNGLAACDACHMGSYTEYTCYACHDTHQQAEMIQVHPDEVLNGEDLDNCAGCHTSDVENEGANEIG